MLREIIIRNLATIEEQSISFGDGLNVITGETGAGKSVILKAIELILGGKGSAELIRTGHDFLEVQALFDLQNLSSHELSLFPEDLRKEQEIVVKRLISTNSKNKIQINGNLATLQQLAVIGPVLLSICSQGQNLNLLDKNYHLEIIDFYADNQEILSRYHVTFQEWKNLRTRLQDSEKEWGDAELELADLEAEIEVLRSLGLHPNRREELTTQIDLVKGQEHLSEIKQSIDHLLNSEIGLFEVLRKLGLTFKDLKRSKIASENLEVIMDQLSDLSQQLEQETQEIQFDISSEEQLEAIEDRLAELARLHRKYRTDDVGLISILNSKLDRFHSLSNLDSPDKLRMNFNAKNDELLLLLATLTKKRVDAVSGFEKSLIKVLKELNLPNAKIDTRFETFPEPRSSGFEGVEFLISLNPGEVCKPLRKVASGGEMSRILLALKSIFNQSQSGCCFIFDEIDTGISGATARIVGEKLRSIAEASQVLCITHLAQVASLAEHHLKVEKKVTDRTFTTVTLLTKTQRVDEIARLLSGREISDTARASASELIQYSHK